MEINYSDLADLRSQLRDLSYELRMLSINIEYLFVTQRHQIEYLASMNKSEVCYRSKEILDKIERLNGKQCANAE